MTKKKDQKYVTPGGKLPIEDAKGKTPKANKLPKHALHPRGRNRGM